MPDKTPLIKVTSPSFSRNELLRQELLQFFPNAVFNDGGGHLSGTALVDFLRDADGAVIGLESVNDEVLAVTSGLRIVAKYGVGLDNVDLEACRKRNIVVGWTGGVNRRSAAELAVCFMIGLCRNVFNTSTRLRRGEWNKDGGMQLSGRTVGIIGVGHIGKEVVHLLAPFRCTILANDIIEQGDYYRENGLIAADKDEIYRRADIVTLHVPSTALTRHMINSKTLRKMRPSAYLINIARGDLVRQSDLKQALQDGTIAGAALDVFESEPPADMELLSLRNLICTSHIGGSAVEAVLAMGRSAIHHLRSHFGT